MQHTRSVQQMPDYQIHVHVAGQYTKYSKQATYRKHHLELSVQLQYVTGKQKQVDLLLQRGRTMLPVCLVSFN